MSELEIVKREDPSWVTDVKDGHRDVDVNLSDPVRLNLRLRLGKVIAHRYLGATSLF